MNDKKTAEDVRLFRRIERLIERTTVESVLASEVVERLDLEHKVDRIKRATVFNSFLVIGLNAYLIYKRVI